MFRLTLFLAAVLSGIAAPREASAATPLLISPTIVEIAAGRRGGAIEITNRSDRPVDIQMRGLDWSQPEGADRMTPAAGLVLSPAIATIAGGATQLFRIVPTTPAATAERAFRIRINELPRPGDGDGAIAINLEFLVPVFVASASAPAGAAAVAALGWRATAGTIEIVNRGARRVRLASAAVVGDDGRRTVLPGSSPAWILAGGRRRFPAPPFPARRIEALTDMGPIDVAADQAR